MLLVHRNFVPLLVVILLACAIGLASHRAHATSDTIPCGSAISCTGGTTSFVDPGTDAVYASGVSSSSATASSAFAWIRATNYGHYGGEEDSDNCHYWYYSPSQYCTTRDVEVCSVGSLPPAGCETDYNPEPDYCNPTTVCYYATTWHYWDVGTTYSTFTATTSDRANSYCWNNLTCDSLY